MRGTLLFNLLVWTLIARKFLGKKKTTHGDPVKKDQAAHRDSGKRPDRL